MFSFPKLPHVRFSIVVCAPKQFGTKTSQHEYQPAGILVEKNQDSGILTTEGMFLFERLCLLMLLLFKGRERALQYVLESIPGFIFDPEQVTFYQTKQDGRVTTYRALVRVSADELMLIKNPRFRNIELREPKSRMRHPNYNLVTAF